MVLQPKYLVAEINSIASIPVKRLNNADWRNMGRIADQLQILNVIRPTQRSNLAAISHRVSAGLACMPDIALILDEVRNW